MTSTPRRRLRRRAAWSVPVVTAGVVAAATVLPGSAFGNAQAALDPRTPAQLLAAVQTSTSQPLSGTVVETARLGLPTVPGADRSASLGWQSLITGSHTARVWADGPSRQRLALLGRLAESDVVRNGTDLWTYASDTTTVTHALVPPQLPTSGLPQAAADQALAAVGPGTAVTVQNDAVVAGRPTYTLRLAPRGTGSTIRQVLIAVDSATSVPLRVQVYAAGVDPAFETAFTDISFARPPASVFAFVPPAGATVRATGQIVASNSDAASRLQAAAAPVSHRMLGTGWTSIAVFPAPAASRLTAGADSAALLRQLSTLRPNGDRLLQTPLVNALLTRDGRVFAGAVTPGLLLQAAAGNPG
jgi:outer membrane lipoprotein-sorting protein